MVLFLLPPYFTKQECPRFVKTHLTGCLNLYVGLVGSQIKM